jgi:hypothetical protein
MHGSAQECMYTSIRICKEGEHLKDISVDGTLIEKGILKKNIIRGCEMELFDLE